MKSFRYLHSVVMIAFCSFGLQACSDDVAVRRPEPQLGEIATITDTRQLVLPFDAYMAFRNRWSAADRAINMLGRACMRRFGLDWPIVETTPPDTEVIDNGRRYGLFDGQLAERLGYHRDEAARNWQPVKERDPTEQERAVWAGNNIGSLNNHVVPKGGCAAEAMRKLEEGTSGKPAIDIQQLGLQSHQFAEADSRVVASTKQWSTCMAGRGYRYATAFEAMDDPHWWEQDAISQSEIETARADVACKRETNLIGVFYAVEAAYQKRMIEESPEQFASQKLYYETIIRNGARLIATGG